MRCDARAHNALVSADERLRAARSERAGSATGCACVRVTEHSAPYGSRGDGECCTRCVRVHGTVPSGGQDKWWRGALRSISTTVSPEISSCQHAHTSQRPACTTQLTPYTTRQTAYSVHCRPYSSCALGLTRVCGPSRPAPHRARDRRRTGCRQNTDCAALAAAPSGSCSSPESESAGPSSL
jgi:hypothetical protein